MNNDSSETDLIRLEVLENGNLKMSLAVQAREEAREEIANLHQIFGEVGTLAELLEPLACNGGYAFVDGAAGEPFVGLTSAPCIAESLTHNEDGQAQVEGRLWWFPAYEVRGVIDELVEHSEVTWTAAPDNTPKPGTRKAPKR
jgi:hypothetical protein